MRSSHKPDNRPSTQWYWDDWMTAWDLRRCGAFDRGVWMDMLAVMWTAPRRGYLETKSGALTMADLSRIVGEPLAEVKQSVNRLETEGVFTRDGEGTIYCRRYVREQKHRDNKAKAGRIGAAKRWDGGTHAQGGMAKHGSPTPSPSPPPTSTPKKKNKRGEYSALFERLWKAYPIKKEKAKAFEEFEKVNPGEWEVDGWIEKVKAYIKHKDEKEGYQEFCPELPYLRRWIKNRRWEDEIESGPV